MPTACLNQPRCRVRLESERLIVSGPVPDAPKNTIELRELPLRDLARVIAVESAQFTSESIGALLRREIPLTILSHGGEFPGCFQPAINDHGRSRMVQYQRHLDVPWSLALDLFTHDILTAR